MAGLFERLGSPRFIVAPMVDQSELPWRMLSRKYGAELCFTPMYSANTIVNDPTYKKMVLADISCEEDRPLIVQFCANKPETFLQAAKIVQDSCDAVDLNLGCPQHIARRGFYGAFLQDEWELLTNIISLAAKNLSVPVTAKIRVFDELQKTIDYAKMLESAGCALLTVHGRTRDQIRENTGLANWDFVRKIKSHLKIPVISNGNIRIIDDIKECMNYTFCDGVMVAETQLHNPAVFLGENPRVHDIMNEYLDLVEQHPCKMSACRSHMFRLWTNTLDLFPKWRETLSTANDVQQLRRINEELHQLCMNEPRITSYLPRPHWICQYHDRSMKPAKSLAAKPPCDKNATTNGLSKNQLKRQKKYERKIEAQKFKRQQEKTKEQKKLRNIVKRHEENQLLPNLEYCTVRRKDRMLERLEEAMKHDSGAMRICVDLSWSNNMNDKEICKLANQIGRIYGSHRRAVKPVHLYFTGFSKESFLHSECVRKHQGFTSYRIDMQEQSHTEIFNLNEIVYLTPDAEEELVELTADKVYILGGIVDETISRKLTLKKAEETEICCRKLPIISHFKRSETHPNCSTVLAANQVFDILLGFAVSGDWVNSILKGLPKRNGYIPK